MPSEDPLNVHWSLTDAIAALETLHVLLSMLPPIPANARWQVVEASVRPEDRVTTADSMRELANSQPRAIRERVVAPHDSARSLGTLDQVATAADRVARFLYVWVNFVRAQIAQRSPADPEVRVWGQRADFVNHVVTRSMAAHASVFRAMGIRVG